MNPNLYRTSLAAAPRRAFTLVELVAVIVIVMVLIATAAPNLARTSVTSRTALRMIQKDLAAARERAIATGRRTWVTFDTSVHSYVVKQESASSPGKAGATAITDPATGIAFLRRLNTGEFAGVTLTSVSADSASEIGFDWKGTPLNATEAALAGNATITVSNASTITVRALTGAVTSP